MHPAIEVAIFKLQFMVLSSVGLQPYGHLCVLLDQQLELELLVLHRVEYLYTPIQAQILGDSMGTVRLSYVWMQNEGRGFYMLRGILTSGIISQLGANYNCR